RRWLRIFTQLPSTRISAKANMDFFRRSIRQAGRMFRARERSIRSASINKQNRSQKNDRENSLDGNANWIENYAYHSRATPRSQIHGTFRRNSVRKLVFAVAIFVLAPLLLVAQQGLD